MAEREEGAWGRRTKCTAEQPAIVRKHCSREAFAGRKLVLPVQGMDRWRRKTGHSGPIGPANGPLGPLATGRKSRRIKEHATGVS